MMRAAGMLALALLAGGVAGAKETDPPCAKQVFEGSRFTVCTFDTQAHEMRLVWEGSGGQALRGFGALERWLGLDGSRVRFAMNAGMFDATGAPIGLFVANGKAEHALQTGTGSGNFFLKPNGVFLIDEASNVRVETTEAYFDEADETYVARFSKAVSATQSGPMLVVDGALNPTFQADGPSRFVRNGVGVREASIALFAISEEPVSFGKFARFFRDGLGCANALYLDGAVSSLWVPRQGRMDGANPLGPMVVVENKSPEG